MLRNAVIHVANEQPLMVDLVFEPSPGDVSLVCRNMRTMNGTKPVFVDFADSTFVFPVSQVRFIEIPAKSYAEAATEAAVEGEGATQAPRGVEPDESEAPLAAQIEARRAKPDRLGSAPASWSPPGGTGGADSPDEPAPDEGLDTDLLRRIREA